MVLFTCLGRRVSVSSWEVSWVGSNSYAKSRGGGQQTELSMWKPLRGKNDRNVADPSQKTALTWECDCAPRVGWPWSWWRCRWWNCRPSCGLGTPQGPLQLPQWTWLDGEASLFLFFIISSGLKALKLAAKWVLLTSVHNTILVFILFAEIFHPSVITWLRILKI